jgi:hypothetical protein
MYLIEKYHNYLRFSLRDVYVNYHISVLVLILACDLKDKWACGLDEIKPLYFLSKQ